MFGMVAMSAALDGLVNEAAWINEAKVSVDPVEVNASGFVFFPEFKVTHLLTISPDRSQCVPPIRCQTPAFRFLRNDLPHHFRRQQETVLIWGVGGTVGTCAIQYAS